MGSPAACFARSERSVTRRGDAGVGPAYTTASGPDDRMRPHAGDQLGSAGSACGGSFGGGCVCMLGMRIACVPRQPLAVPPVSA
eukprot:358499-Chlamydomonas_euryale.AAC.2